MKILALSLLRLGDLMLQKPLMEALRQKHPHSEIHLLMNKQFSQVEFLFQGVVDKFIYFDRESLQKSCGEKEYGIFWGVHQLKNFILELNQNSYDVVYNFTHNRLTAHLAGLIQARTRVGIYSWQGSFYGLTNPWIQFFNNFFGRPEAWGFHYSELLAKALELPLPQNQASKVRPAKGPGRILIQPLTSDTKKNWSLQKVRSLVIELERKTPHEVLVLGAPFEKEKLSQVFAEKNLRICDLKEAEALLRKSVLLITGDTSIKHLAAMSEVAILELSLGSSQPLQVGAYSNNSVILQPRVSCGPCPHSQPCSKASHFCGEGLPVDAVFEAAQLLLKLEKSDWDYYSYKYPELNVLKTATNDVVGWSVQCLSTAQRDQFEHVLQKKMMIIEELDRRSYPMKGVSNEQQRTRKLPLTGVEAP